MIIHEKDFSYMLSYYISMRVPFTYKKNVIGFSNSEQRREKRHVSLR